MELDLPKPKQIIPKEKQQWIKSENVRNEYIVKWIAKFFEIILFEKHTLSTFLPNR